MSKQISDPWDYSDPVPSYEECVGSNTKPTAVKSSAPSRGKTPRNASSPVHSMIRQERTRRIQDLIDASILPCFSAHLANAVNNLTIVIVPSGALPSTPTEVTAVNVVMPSFQSLSTTGAVLPLSGEEGRSSFWTQQAVLQELDILLNRHLTGRVPQQDPLADRQAPKPESQYHFAPCPTPELPERPQKKSWFKRALPQLPGPEHDPTGETGKWDLGWRTPIQEGNDATRMNNDITRHLKPDEIAISTRFHDVSFRTENEMGLLETTTLRCPLVKIEVGV